MEIEHLENSCRRLPEMIKEKAPLVMVVTEFQLLSELAFAAILKIHASQIHNQLAARRKTKKTKKTEERDEDNEDSETT